MPSRSPSPSVSGLEEDEDGLLPSPSELDPTSDLYASYVAAYNAALPSPTSTPTPASIPMRLPRGGAAEAQHRRKLSQLGELDKRFNPPPPSVWSRAALVLGLVGLLVAAVWMRMGVLEGKREGSRAAIKYAKEHGVMEERVTLSGGIPAKEL